jgi:hypothetical protein
MGRNGKKPSVFTEMVNFINNNAGKKISSKEILLGKEPGRNSETAYLYKFIKLEYVKAVNDGFVMHKDTMYEIVKPFPKHYNSVMFMDELRVANGFIADNHERKLY